MNVDMPSNKKSSEDYIFCSGIRPNLSKSEPRMLMQKLSSRNLDRFTAILAGFTICRQFLLQRSSSLKKRGVLGMRLS